jgi:hypothetical protein
LNLERSPSRPALSAGALCVASALAIVFASVFASCTASEVVDFDALPSGAAGHPGGGSSGVGGSGAAGTTTGAAGSTSGPAGAAGKNGGAAGSTSGHAGGGGQGVAGSTGSSGAGMTGAAGAKVDAGASGAGGVLVTDGGYPLTYSAYILPMLNNACGGCHFDGGTMAPKGGFGYTSYAKLVGPVSSATTGCTSLDASKRRVVPGHPENSLIFIKVSVQNPPSGCGGHMPYMGTNMSAENQADLKAWILSGAPQ